MWCFSSFALPPIVYSNIEDITRDAGSVNIEEDVLDSMFYTLQLYFLFLAVMIMNGSYYLLIELQMELQQLCPVNALIYQPLYEMAQVI